MLGDKHGEVHFKLENNIITATFIGSFNLEGALVYTEGIKPLIHSLGNKPFGILVDNRLMEGGSLKLIKR